MVCFFGTPELTAQSTHILGKSVYELRTETVAISSLRSFTLLPRYLLVPESETTAPDLRSFQSTVSAYQAPATYQYQDLAFFCRLEVKLEQASKIPVRFRLGSVDYVDYLEGKRQGY